MKDIKKRFIDILFESDDEDEEEVVPVAEPVKKKEAVKKEETSFNAKDVGIHQPGRDDQDGKGE